MTDFIHSLILPTAICTFDGEFVEVNNSLLSECKASTKSQLFNYRTTELFVDGSNYGRLVDTLIDGKTILNQEVLLYFFDNKIDMVISSMSLLSLESKLVIIQNQPVKLTRYLSQERFDILLKEMQKLRPYLNKTGQSELNKIYENNVDVFSNLQLKSDIVDFTRKLILTYPTLSNSELYVCSNLICGFSNREILYLTGYTLNNLRVVVHRICRKLGVDSREELIKMFMSLNIR